jgi:hypothetical protein
VAIRLSDAAAALVIGNTGLRGAITGAKINFYTGAQPTSANDSIGTAQPIITFSSGGSGVTFAAPQDGSGLSPAEDVFYIEKTSSETWSGQNGFDSAGTVFSGITNGDTYQAGWARIIVSVGDTGSDATSGTSGYVRVDFSIGIANADCDMLPNTSFLVNTASGSEITSVMSEFILKINKQMN